MLRTSSVDSTTLMDDITTLPYSDHERVVGYMRARFLAGHVYTWAGKVLLCVQTYSTNVELQPSPSLAPSVYAVVDRVWFRLRQRLGRNQQAIVVSGESGAGKTYSTCMAIKSLASRDADHDDDGVGAAIIWKVWASVPLLNAFGNAPTLINANSSRFGKLLRLQYVGRRLRGAAIETYLIEKSRVASVNIGEGNFHIFRQLLDSLDDERLAELMLARDCEYRIAPRIGLKSTFEETVKSLEILNIDELDDILIVLAAVLNLGNVQFIDNSHCHGDSCEGSFYIHPESLQFAENAAYLLHVRAADLCEILCNTQFASKSGGGRRQSILKTPCTNIQDCEARRDCIMKHLYERLFCWLVNAINFRIFIGQAEEFINLLDLYGFEMFENNTFEQLCINYANERLQHYFNRCYLAEERQALLLDGFEVENLEYDDYTQRIYLLDGQISIFGILNEECMMKRFKDDLYLNSRFGQSFRSNRNFFINDETQSYFSIRHYAGVVKYNVNTMIAKNRDKVPNDIETFLRNCPQQFVRTLLDHAGNNNGSNRRTILTYFKKSFDDLITSFDQCDMHYIKCLKPNAYRISEYLDEDYFTQQMRSNGVFELLKLSFQNYAIKMPNEIFNQRFTPMVVDFLMPSLVNQMHIGNRNIYMTECCYLAFERVQYLRHTCAARVLQRYFRIYLKRRHDAARIIQSFVRLHILYRKNSSIDMRSSSFIGADDTSTTKLHDVHVKIQEYLNHNKVEINFEGAPLSLHLERVWNHTNTKKFRRVLFCNDRLVSYFKLAEVPIRFHLSKTCIHNSHLLPRSEMPQGLVDIF